MFVYLFGGTLIKITFIFITTKAFLLYEAAINIHWIAQPCLSSGLDEARAEITTISDDRESLIYSHTPNNSKLHQEI